jgi:hypothetical protein
MAITYPLTFPSIGIRSMTIRARNIVGFVASPFTGSQQVYKHPGQFWEAEVTMPPMKRADAEQIAAFLLSLNGRYGTFLLGDPANTSPRGVGTGTPLVNGSNQTGQDLVTDGWTADQTGILKAGDWIQIGSGLGTHLYKVLAHANSDASGNATFTIWPDIRSGTGDDSVITVSSPKGLWRLAANDTEFSIDQASIYGITFPCVEAI